MTSSPEGAGDLPPGVAPSFGDVPLTPFEHTPERLVLSSEAHSHLSVPASLATLSGPFHSEPLGNGVLTIQATEQAGEVHVHADMSPDGGPSVHLDARVRESWLARAAHSEGGVTAPVQVVRELIRLSEIPSQSTVTIRVDSVA